MYFTFIEINFFKIPPKLVYVILHKNPRNLYHRPSLYRLHGGACVYPGAGARQILFTVAPR